MGLLLFQTALIMHLYPSLVYHSVLGKAISHGPLQTPLNSMRISPGLAGNKVMPTHELSTQKCI